MAITITKPVFMTETEWYYFKRQFRTFQWSKAKQTEHAHTFHDGWETAAEDDHRRSVGEDLPE